MKSNLLSLLMSGILLGNAAWAMKPEIITKHALSLGSIAFNPENHLIFSYHPFYSPDIRIAKLKSPTRFEPFPNAPREGTDQYFENVLSLRSDEDGVVWMIYMGSHTGITTKLVGWNTKTNKLERIYYLPKPATRDGSQPQDSVIACRHRKFFAAAEGIGARGNGSQDAIIVIDMESGVTRRVAYLTLKYYLVFAKNDFGKWPIIHMNAMV